MLWKHSEGVGLYFAFCFLTLVFLYLVSCFLWMVDCYCCSSVFCFICFTFGLSCLAFFVCLGCLGVLFFHRFWSTFHSFLLWDFLGLFRGNVTWRDCETWFRSCASRHFTRKLHTVFAFHLFSLMTFCFSTRQIVCVRSLCRTSNEIALQLIGAVLLHHSWPALRFD